MCVSVAPADFKATTLYLGLKNHPVYGRIFLLVYQNTAINYHNGPNAMLLHLPGVGMSQSNFIDTRKSRSVLKDMIKALSPKPNSYSQSNIQPASIALGVTVFEHDIYTIVLASDASQIPRALHQVPANKRIQANQPLFDFYAQHFPGYAVALCCFDNRDARRAAPLMLWYQPMDPEYFRLPALDCHTGNLPALYEKVAVDHWVILGSDEMPAYAGAKVYYTDNISTELNAFLPDQVIGRYYRGKMPNGDFGFKYNDVRVGNMLNMERLLPPGISQA